jgi:hypothetical protein
MPKEKRSRLRCRHITKTRYSFLLCLIIICFSFFRPDFVYFLLCVSCLCSCPVLLTFVFHSSSFYFYLVFLVRSLFLRFSNICIFPSSLLLFRSFSLYFICLHFASLSSFTVNLPSLFLFLLSLFSGDNAMQYNDCLVWHYSYHTVESLGHFWQTSGLQQWWWWRQISGPVFTAISI